MPSYFVNWEIDIFDVANPREAAQQAFAHMQRRGTLATAFKVIEHDSNGEAVTIDLLEESMDDLTVTAIEEAIADDVHR
ncbi:hypothetical protein J2045_003378 [Peteryoungia aggregata LMG 23059]|uniref:Uncharacterized protein n=1 Tax=Peteryoungia aggregata LMG 23059 TaxID=1368425 RepID=A0ABU0GAF1_9HYPH|nr:hypothetical protein [Peteryoungia aggregata]MDQ0422330.1 hypothetical protein [Peteryoungia aggregata LMG 23059]